MEKKLKREDLVDKEIIDGIKEVIKNFNNEKDFELTSIINYYTAFPTHIDFKEFSAIEKVEESNRYELTNDGVGRILDQISRKFYLLKVKFTLSGENKEIISETKFPTIEDVLEIRNLLLELEKRRDKTLKKFKQKK